MSAYYLDNSAGAKLLTGEPGSDVVRSLVTPVATTLMSSGLFAVELRRALARWAARAGSEVERELASSLCDDLLGRVRRMPISEVVLERAASLGPSTLRSLDAIHLATALILNEHAPLAGLLTFDRALAQAATSAGLAVPGLD